MNTITIPEQEIPEFYRGYVSLLNGTPFLDQLRSTLISTPAFFSNIPASKWDSGYAPGKWTLKEVLLHIIDTERIFSYRALRFSRNDSTPLPGFDEETFTPESGAGLRSPESLIREYQAVRNSTIALFENLSPEMLKRTGTANQKLISVRAIGFATAGHELHHLKVIRERYLV